MSTELPKKEKKKEIPTLEEYKSVKEEVERLKNQLVDFLRESNLRALIEANPNIELNFQNPLWVKLRTQLVDEWGKLEKEDDAYQKLVRTLTEQDKKRHLLRHYDLPANIRVKLDVEERSAFGSAKEGQPETYTDEDLAMAQKEAQFWHELHATYPHDDNGDVVRSLLINKDMDTNRRHGQIENAIKSRSEPNKPKYTLEDLEKERQWDSGFGPNNPGAERRKNIEHGRRLREIEEYLKAQGVLEKTKEEKVIEELDKLYPNAKSKTIVEYGGKRYQIKYSPVEKSRSGKTVKEWDHAWQPVE
jgi:hypothetical protein